MLRGALAAALTPLRDAGEALDEEAFGPYVDFLAAGGVDGILALGTTGEGFLLPVEQRLRAAQLFAEASRGRLLFGVHCGAQSTWDTVELAAHAADIGADGVYVTTLSSKDQAKYTGIQSMCWNLGPILAMGPFFYG